MSGLTLTRTLSLFEVSATLVAVTTQSAGTEGAVELEYRIGANGNVGQIRVVSAHPAGIFDEAAKTALRGWQFPPASGGEKRTQNSSESKPGDFSPRRGQALSS